MDSPEFPKISKYLYDKSFGALLYDLHNPDIGFSFYDQCGPETTDLCFYTMFGILIEEPADRGLLNSSENDDEFFDSREL